jgi:hypothetical protein
LLSQQLLQPGVLLLKPLPLHGRSLQQGRTLTRREGNLQWQVEIWKMTDFLKNNEKLRPFDLKVVERK